MGIRPALRLKNSARRVRDDWWSWSVWLEGPDEALDEVASVRYTLHPSFPDPIRVVSDRPSKFKLESSGWGEFALSAQVSTKQGEVVPLERWVQFIDPSYEDTETGSRRPCVFMSFSTTDQPMVRPLMRSLEQQGVEVLSSAQMKAEESWSESIREMLSRADIIALVTSGDLRPFAERELDQAIRQKKPVFPILLGQTEGALPPTIEHIKAVRLASAEQTDAVADLLAARAKDAFYED